MNKDCYDTSCVYSVYQSEDFFLNISFIKVGHFVLPIINRKSFQVILFLIIKTSERLKNLN